VVNHAPIPRFAITGLPLGKISQVQYTTVCHNRNNTLAICSQIKLLTVAIRGTIIFLVPNCGMIILFMTIRSKIFFFMANRGMHLSAVCHNRVKSTTSHFTSTVLLFAAPYIFESPLYKCKTYVANSPKLTTKPTTVDTLSRDTIPLI
jgi:hypothetical protein